MESKLENYVNMVINITFSFIVHINQNFISSFYSIVELIIVFVDSKDIYKVLIIQNLFNLLVNIIHFDELGNNLINIVYNLIIKNTNELKIKIVDSNAYLFLNQSIRLYYQQKLSGDNYMNTQFFRFTTKILKMVEENDSNT